MRVNRVDAALKMLRGGTSERSATPGSAPHGSFGALDIASMQRSDVAALAKLVETRYCGAMIGGAIHRGSAPADWMREQVGAVLEPHRHRE